MFVKVKYETPNLSESFKKPSLCTHCKKTGHSQFRCYTRFLKTFETQKNRLMNDFNSLKNNILNNGKENKTNQKPGSQPSSSKSPSRTKQVLLRKDRVKCQVVFNALKAKSSRKWYLDNGYSIRMAGNRTYFTSLENYNGGTIVFGYGSLDRVKGKGSIVIPSCPILDGVLYVEGLKENLPKISQMCNKDHRVNTCQDLCQVVKKEGKIVITGHKKMDNYYTINPNSRKPLVYSREKIDRTEL